MLRHATKTLGARLTPARVAAVNSFHTSPMVESSLPKKNGAFSSFALQPTLRNAMTRRTDPINISFTLTTGTTQVGEGPKALSSSVAPSDLTGGTHPNKLSPAPFVAKR